MLQRIYQALKNHKQKRSRSMKNWSNDPVVRIKDHIKIDPTIYIEMTELVKNDSDWRAFHQLLANFTHKLRYGQESFIITLRFTEDGMTPVITCGEQSLPIPWNEGDV